jgi:hypothetical protein
MSLFRRRESLHERLARQGGLEESPAPIDPGPHWGEVGIHGVHRPRQWDAVVTAEAPALEGDEVVFVTLPDGSLLVEAEEGDADVSPLAEAIETQVEPPYRARAVRQKAEIWTATAKRIRVAEFAAEGDAIDLAFVGGERTLRVDGLPVFGSIGELEELGHEAGPDYAIHAERLDANLWEVEVSRL